ASSCWSDCAASGRPEQSGLIARPRASPHGAAFLAAPWASRSPRRLLLQLDLLPYGSVVADDQLGPEHDGSRFERGRGAGFLPVLLLALIVAGVAVLVLVITAALLLVVVGGLACAGRRLALELGPCRHLALDERFVARQFDREHFFAERDHG